MNDILKNYSQEEIELLALQQLEEGTLEETATLKIVKIIKIIVIKFFVRQSCDSPILNITFHNYR